MAAFKFTANPIQIASYVGGVALFSISFLVFLNSSISFVITDRIGLKDGVGDAVGTLGFADELVALVACPIWGVLSDRIGVRLVAVIGYLIVGLSLMLLVQATNIYPQLLLARLFFSIGGAATATMVTAILPAMTYEKPNDGRTQDTFPSNMRSHRHSVAPSVSSELTITPARYRTQSPLFEESSNSKNSPAAAASQLAGVVGMFTGLGALIALLIFLPLPATFQNRGDAPSDAVAKSFYVVGTISFVVAAFCFLGLRDLPGEDGKGWHHVGSYLHQFKSNPDVGYEELTPDLPPYHRLLYRAFVLGFKDVNIGLGYLGGFVARASSVAISLFIPVFVNAYFISSGLCSGDSGSDIRHQCNRAYKVAAALSGASQLVALLCAPVYGYLSSKYVRFNEPLLLAAISGIAGYLSFGLVRNPDYNGEDGSVGVFFIVALLGISQIGAIVCSLGLLARGIQTSEPQVRKTANGEAGDGHSVGGSDSMSSTRVVSPSITSNGLRNPLDETGLETTDGTIETQPLLSNPPPETSTSEDRRQLKGSIAGIYSLAGGAGILLLTKVGGVLFDKWDRGAPFFLMAIFNGILFCLTTGYAFMEFVRPMAQRNMD
ncbi:hypothetical protein P152DRAFT_455127 [Eremomyces bilateralis CBS 781.70]|uniref:MFS general substrate transporter n=1 Tax=Eremomyces bilateralis CBS 781.70 TaxID=1392243 RepID=A0A6G1GBR6_9PEZI|nr:uncharacterized protein P152DRAFT_455127 [Eremomyces bilateralis CBS 781.70]KAF1815422.1 hypothetical protein P152DRAFT_455127 [Eremomyces bilateralis CBS 781.70]